MGWKFQLRQDCSVRFNTSVHADPSFIFKFICYVNGSPKTIFFFFFFPKTIFFGWDLVLQSVSPRHFKFFILTQILSHKLGKWQSAPPARFQLNSFTFDFSAFLFISEGSDQILHSFNIFLVWPLAINSIVILCKIAIIIFVRQFFQII